MFTNHQHVEEKKRFDGLIEGLIEGSYFPMNISWMARSNTYVVPQAYRRILHVMKYVSYHKRRILLDMHLFDETSLYRDQRPRRLLSSLNEKVFIDEDVVV